MIKNNEVNNNESSLIIKILFKLRLYYKRNFKSVNFKKLKLMVLNNPFFEINNFHCNLIQISK